MQAYVRRKQWEAELLAAKQAEMQVKLWLESGMVETLLENHAAKLATEVWRIAHSMRGSRNAPPSLFGKGRHNHNGDGLRRRTGPGSFDAMVEAARLEALAKQSQDT